MAGEAALYLRELDQLGSPERLAAWMKASPFRRALFHANAETAVKTARYAAACRQAGIRVGVYATPGGLTPQGYPAQVAHLLSVARRCAADEAVLDMEAPWRDATPDQVLGCCRQAASGGLRIRVTTVPGHPVLRVLARLSVAAIAVQVYDRHNTFSEKKLRAICAAARRIAPRCDFDLPAWNKTPERLERHLRNIPACAATRYWMADNPGIDDLPGPALLEVIRRADPALRAA